MGFQWDKVARILVHKVGWSYPMIELQIVSIAFDASNRGSDNDKRRVPCVKSRLTCMRREGLAGELNREERKTVAEQQPSNSLRRMSASSQLKCIVHNS
jgi:hypothetical protein